MLGRRQVRSVLGPLPLGTLVAAGAYELAVHTLDLAPAGRPAAVADPAVRRAGRPRRHDRWPGRPVRHHGRGRLRLAGGRLGLRRGATGAWTTLELPAVPPSWPAVQGRAADLLDASAGRRAVPPMLARRDLRLHHVTGLLALAPIVEAVPGLPGGSALQVGRCATCAGVSRLVRRLPGVPG